jgi:hypothetical protein
MAAEAPDLEGMVGGGAGHQKMSRPRGRSSTFCRRATPSTDGACSESKASVRTRMGDD